MSVLSTLVLLAILWSFGHGNVKPMPGLRLSLAQLRDLAARTGFADPHTAAAIAMAESGGNPSAANIVPQPKPGNLPERSFGLWQVNTLANPQYDETQLLDPAYNASAALAISRGGTNFSPWSTFNNGLYKRYL